MKGHLKLMLFPQRWPVVVPMSCRIKIRTERFWIELLLMVLVLVPSSPLVTRHGL